MQLWVGLGLRAGAWGCVFEWCFLFVRLFVVAFTLFLLFGWLFACLCFLLLACTFGCLLVCVLVCALRCLLVLIVFCLFVWYLFFCFFACVVGAWGLGFDIYE